MAGLDWLCARPIAHRGYHRDDAPPIENTLAAAAAIERGFSIECDVQCTADDTVVVFHDDTLDRITTASGRVDRSDLADLRAARFKNGEAGIPTLAVLLDLVDGRVPLVIELKSQWTNDRRLEVSVARILSTYTGPVAVMSFEPASLVAMRRLAPNLPRGLIAEGFAKADVPIASAASRAAMRHLLWARYVLPDFVAYDVAGLPASAPLARRHFSGLPLLTWTVRDAADRATARQWADQIIFEGFDPHAS